MEEKGRLPEPNQEELEACSIEELFERLNQVIGGLEDGSSSLEDSFRYYDEGRRLVKACSGKIDRGEKQILVIDEMGGDYGA